MLRDHLCWLWRVGDESSHPVLSQAALLSEQVLRILGVEHSSLDHLLCQVSTRSACVPAFGLAMPISLPRVLGKGGYQPAAHAGASSAHWTAPRNRTDLDRTQRL